jgi:undecaprenyl-diphosphatase
MCASVFTALLLAVRGNHGAVLFDARVMRFVVDHRVAWMTAFLKTVTGLGSNTVLIPLIIALCVTVFLFRRDWRPAAILVVALLGADAWYLTIKDIVERPRPPLALHLVQADSFAFPSGHATAAVAVWGTIAIVFAAGRPRPIAGAIWIGASLIALTVAFSRLYLGVHWWTDVVAGAAVGGAWLCLLAMWWLSSRRGTDVIERSSPETLEAGSAGR